MLGYIGCRKDKLCVGYLVIFYEYDFYLSADTLVVINNVGHRVYKLDRKLCGKITGCCLCSEDISLRIEVLSGMALDIVVLINYLEDIKELTLIFMKSFDLNIKY